MTLLAKQNISLSVSREEGEHNIVECMGTMCVGVIACSVAQREVYVTLQSIHVSREAPRNSSMQHWTLLLLNLFYFNVVNMAIPNLHWYVRGKNLACVFPDMSCI